MLVKGSIYLRLCDKHTAEINEWLAKPNPGVCVRERERDSPVQKIQNACE